MIHGASQFGTLDWNAGNILNYVGTKHCHTISIGENLQYKKNVNHEFGYLSLKRISLVELAKKTSSKFLMPTYYVYYLCMPMAITSLATFFLMKY